LTLFGQWCRSFWRHTDGHRFHKAIQFTMASKEQQQDGDGDGGSDGDGVAEGIDDLFVEQIAFLLSLSPAHP